MSELKVKYRTIWKLMLENEFQLKDKKARTDEFDCSICKQLLINAFNGPCGCRYCYQCISKYLEGQEKLCPSNQGKCQNELLSFNENLKVDHAIDIKISKLIVICPRNLCNYSCELINMNQHLELCNKRQCKSSMDHDQVHALENQIKNLESRIYLKLNTLDNAESSTKFKSSDLEKITEQLITINKKIKEFEENIQKLNARVENTEMTITKLKDDVEKQYYDEYIWKIDKFSEKIKQIETDTNFSIFSDPFYAFKHGYKMCLNFDLDCDDSKVLYLSLFFCIMKGPYDDILPWPMKCEIKFALINQTTKLDFITETGNLSNHPITEELCKPESEKNESYGFAQFIELNKVRNNPALCRGDQIFIKFSVKRV